MDDTEGVRLPAASVTSHDAHTATTSASPAPDRRQESAGNVEQDISSIAQDTEKAIDNVGPQHPSALQAPTDSASPVGETSGLSNTETQETSAHTFSPDLPYFPSSEPPSLSLEASETLARIPMALHHFVRADAITTNKQIAGFCQVMGDDTNNYVVHNAYSKFVLKIRVRRLTLSGPGIRPAILHAMLLAKKKVDSIRYHPSYIVLCSSDVLCTQLKNDCDKIRDLLAGEGIIVPGVGVFTGDMSDNEILRERGKRAPVIITTCGKLLHLHRTGCFSINRARKIVFDQLDCLTIYADDNDSKKVFGYLVSTQRVIVLVSAMTAIVKASWQELVPVGLQNLDNMIQVLNEDCNEMLEMSKYMAWADTASLNHPPTPAVGLITQLAAEGAQQLVLANFKSTISSVNMTGRLVVPDDFLPFHSELAPRNVRLENLEAFRSRQCQILVCARRGIYSAAFPFLPELVPLEIPNTFCEPRYILQW